ncbi:MAG: prefoldin subunit beta [Nanoarchaeota archaeon]
MKAKISKETEGNIQQLQLIEQNLQNFMMQRQNFQMQLLEIENALKELENTKDKPYKIVGNLMVQVEKDDVKKDLNSKKEIIELRIKNLERQEGKLREKADDIQKSIMRELQKNGGS